MLFTARCVPSISGVTDQYAPVEELMSLRESRFKTNSTWSFCGHKIGLEMSMCNYLDRWDAFLESIEFSCFCQLASEYYHVWLGAWSVRAILTTAGERKWHVEPSRARRSKDKWSRRLDWTTSAPSSSVVLVHLLHHTFLLLLSHMSWIVCVLCI